MEKYDNNIYNIYNQNSLWYKLIKKKKFFLRIAVIFKSIWKFFKKLFLTEDEYTKDLESRNINDKILSGSNFYRRRLLENLYGQNSILIIKIKKLIEIL